MPSILFLGATGFIGGAVLVHLQKSFSNSTFRALVRNERAVNVINKFINVDSTLPKVETIIASLEDIERVADLAYEADVVINVADSDSVPLRDGLLKGLKRRYDNGKGVASFIHTSGAAIYWDGTQDGKFNDSGKVWTDAEADVLALAEKMVHGPIDCSLLRAQEEGYMNAFIVCPSCAHGVSPVRRASVYFKSLIGDAFQKKRVVYVGEGSNVTGMIHVDDLASLYVILVWKLLGAAGRQLSSSPYERYIIASAENRVPYKTVATWLAQELYKHGRLDDPEPASVSSGEAGPLLQVITAQNAIVDPKQAYALGWTPTHPTLAETFADDVMVALEAA